jgi:2-amino-4-hydroxy-6-hydroxymethyldihydropteridine diphosphokinase
MDAILSLGSNLGDRLQNLLHAREALACLPQTRLAASSRVYLTEPVGVPPGSCTFEFYNAIVIVATALEPPALLRAAQAIETRLGRRRTSERNLPRPIDIDLIDCGGRSYHDPELQLPHPRALTRRFVCEPLVELRPSLVLPGQTLPVLAILAHLPAVPAVSLAPEQWAL